MSKPILCTVPNCKLCPTWHGDPPYCETDGSIPALCWAPATTHSPDPDDDAGVFLCSPHKEIHDAL